MLNKINFLNMILKTNISLNFKFESKTNFSFLNGAKFNFVKNLLHKGIFETKIKEKSSPKTVLEKEKLLEFATGLIIFKG